MADLPPDREIVQAGIDEAKQALLSAADVPMAMTGELTAAVTSPAVRSALEARIALIVEHGHTIENDDMLPIGWLPMEARHAFEAAREEMMGNQRDLAAVRAKLVSGVAFGLAAIDRLDRAMRGSA